MLSMGPVTHLKLRTSELRLLETLILLPWSESEFLKEKDMSLSSFYYVWYIECLIYIYEMSKSINQSKAKLIQ